MKRKQYLDILTKILNYNDDENILKKINIGELDYLQRNKNKLDFRLLSYIFREYQRIIYRILRGNIFDPKI